MRLETPDGKLVTLKDGLERDVFKTDSAGNVTLPAGLAAASLAVPGGNVSAYADVTFNATQIKALFTTPLELVPAPGAGLALVFDGAVLFYTYGTAGFTIGSASGLGVKYTNGSGLQVGQSAVTGFIDQTANKTRWVNRYHAASGDSSVVPVENALLCAQILTADVTGASAVGTLKVRTYYRTVPFTL